MTSAQPVGDYSRLRELTPSDRSDTSNALLYQIEALVAEVFLP